MPTKKSYSLITMDKCGVLRHTMHWIIPLHFSREIAHGSSHRPPDVAVSRRRGRAQKWQKKLSNPPRPGFQMTKTHATRCARQGQGSHGARDQPRLHLPTPPGPSAARRVQARKHKHPGGQASRSGPGRPLAPARILSTTPSSSSSPVDPFPHNSLAALPLHTVASLASPTQLSTAQPTRARRKRAAVPSHQQRRASDHAGHSAPFSLSLSLSLS